MAFEDRPNGAVPVGTLSGSAWEGHVREFAVDASAANIFPGDFVIMEADGKVAPATAGNTELIGVCVGVPTWMPDKVNGISGHSMTSGANDKTKIYHQTGAAGRVLVCVGTDVIYEMQEDDGSLVLADIGNNCDILATAGSTTTGRSLQEIDSSTNVATTAQLRIVDIVDKPDNELGSAGTRWLVKMNESHFAKTAGI